MTEKDIGKLRQIAFRGNCWSANISCSYCPLDKMNRDFECANSSRRRAKELLAIYERNKKIDRIEELLDE